MRTQLREDHHRYRGNGAGVMATLQAVASSLLRLTGFGSIHEGLEAVMHDITALLAMATRQPREIPASHFASGLVADLVIGCDEGDVKLSNQLIVGLPVEGLPVGPDRQEEVCHLLLELSKNGCCVWNASAWIKTTSKSSSPRSFWRTARPCFLSVA